MTKSTYPKALFALFGACSLLASQAQAQKSYWLGHPSADGTSYVFDVQMPQKLGDHLMQASERDYIVDRAPIDYPATEAGGKSYSFVKCKITYDVAMYERPQYAVQRKSPRAKMSWARGIDAKDPHLAGFRNHVPKPPAGKWHTATLIFAVAPDAEAPKNLRTSIYGEGKRYWLGRRDGADFVFDVPVPHDFGKSIADGDARAHVIDKNPKGYPAQPPYTFTTTTLRWDANPKQASGLNNQAYWTNRTGGTNSWFSTGIDTPAGQQLAAAVGKPKGASLHKDMIILTSPNSTTPTIRMPIPKPALAKMNMRDLGGTTKGGVYYRDTKIPSDLAAFQNEMLNYANLGRRDPNFRKTHKSETATDLSAKKVHVFKGNPKHDRTKVWETITHQSPAPPYFTDLVTRKALNQAAQFQAEWQATSQGKSPFCGHSGPATFSYQGKSGVMAGASDRVAFFGGPKSGWECAGMGDVDTYPHGWMAGETHFRPWFNVNGDIREVGFGIAQGADGRWYSAAVGLTLPNMISDAPPPAAVASKTDSPAPVSTGPALPRAQAEDGTFTGGASKSDIHKGFDGSGFAHNLLKPGSSFSTNIDAKSAGNYQLDLRYAAPDPDRKLSLVVNGQKIGQIAFPKAGSTWDDWKNQFATVPLKAGSNTIQVLYSEGDQGPVNIDYVEAKFLSAAKAQLEDGKLHGGAGIANNHPGFEGTGFVEKIKPIGSGVETEVNGGPKGGPADLKIRYAAADTDRKLSLSINGDLAGKVALPKTGEWTDWGEHTVPVNLKPGSNRIKLSVGPGDVGPVNLDSIAVAPRGSTQPTAVASAGGKQFQNTFSYKERTYVSGVYATTAEAIEDLRRQAGLKDAKGMKTRAMTTPDPALRTR